MREPPKTYLIETIGRQTFWRIADLAERYGVSVTTARKYKNEIKKERERYGRHAVIENGNIVYINEIAWLDYMENATRLKDKNARKYVAPFNPAEWIPYLGYFSRPIVEAEQYEKEH